MLLWREDLRLPRHPGRCATSPGCGFKTTPESSSRLRTRSMAVRPSSCSSTHAATTRQSVRSPCTGSAACSGCCSSPISVTRSAWQPSRYDPEYDRAERLLQYAESWGAKPSAHHRILRTVGDFQALSDYFSLGVNFSASGIVNRHQLEAFVLDKQGHIAHVVSRRRWDEATLLRLAAPLAHA